MARKHRTRRMHQKRKQQRRTRKHKQRGGANEEPITSIDQWINRVKEHRGKFTASATNLEPKLYTFNDLRDAALSIPPLKISAEGDIELTHDFDLPVQFDPKDLRSLGQSIKSTMSSMFEQIPPTQFTAENFARMIDIAAAPDRIADNVDIFNIMNIIEQALRDIAKETSSSPVTIQDTQNRTIYPLYIWYLVMNLPEQEQIEVPVLIEQKEEPIPGLPAPAETAK